MECQHILHFECSKKIFLEEFGDEVFIVTLDKSKLLYPSLIGQKHVVMKYGTKETSGIIHCPECNEKYSVLSPIYRNFGIPKKISKIVLFAYNDEVIMYHLCTNIDVVHLLQREYQDKILNDFSYFEEDECFYKHKIDTKNNVQICMLEKFDDFIFHAVLVNGVFVVFPESSCPACDCEKNPIKYLEDPFEYKHASVMEYLNFINPIIMFDDGAV